VVKIVFWRKESQSDFVFFYSVGLIDHSIGNKGVEIYLPELSGILPKFSTNQNFWGCACTPSSDTTEWIARHLHRKKACSTTKPKYAIFPAECTSHFRCITSPLDNLRCKQQFEKLLPSSSLGYSQFKCNLCGLFTFRNLAELLKDV